MSVCPIIVVRFNSHLFTSEVCVGLLVISYHNLLLCLSFSASTPFSLFSYKFIFSYFSRFLTMSLIFHSCFPVEDCQCLASVVLSRFLMVNFIFLFFFSFSEFYPNFPVDSFLLSCLPHCLKFCQINMKFIFLLFKCHNKSY